MFLSSGVALIKTLNTTNSPNRFSASPLSRSTYPYAFHFITPCASSELSIQVYVSGNGLCTCVTETCTTPPGCEIFLALYFQRIRSNK